MALTVAGNSLKLIPIKLMGIIVFYFTFAAVSDYLVFKVA